jgi:rhodanese-related sulfurtransferase
MSDGGSGKTAAELVAEAKQRVVNLTVDDVAAEVESGDPLIVDIREPAERDENGSIPGAISAPRGMLEFYADPTSPYHRAEFDPNRRVILHCAAGGRSALAADTLQQMGYTNVAHLDGGFTAWKQAGQRVEGGTGS